MRSTSSPLLKIPRVGMLITLYFAATPPFSSTSSLTTLSLPVYSPASASTIGAIILHGPHQVAQKSTRTGMGDFSTSLSNACSVTAGVVPAIERFLPLPHSRLDPLLLRTEPFQRLFPSFSRPTPPLS